MSIEGCANFRRARPDRSPQMEVSWCAKVGTDMKCAGSSDLCPPKMRRHFVSERGVPYEQVTFDTTEIDLKNRRDL